jgi:hypothetical protein
MKLVAASVVLLLLATGMFSTNVLAGSAWSPQVRVVALEVVEASGVLRLGVRRSIEYNEPAFDFNPAVVCTDLIDTFTLLGTNTQTHYFDVQFGEASRSATEQRQLLNEIYAAFATGRAVKLSVRDDLCTMVGGRVVSGIQVIY